MAETSAKRKTALLVVNDKARAGASELTAVIEALAAAGIAADLERPGSPEEADALVREVGPKVDLVIVGGGDGTISHLLGALLAVSKPVGILPLGTANDLARTLSLPTDIGEAVAVIASGNTRSIDVGMIDDRPFVNVAHLGLGSEVARAHEGPAKRIFGVFAYPLHWYRAYRNSRPIWVRLKADDRQMRLHCAQLAIGAGVYYGGGLRVADDANPDDGLLKLYAIGPRPILGWIKLLGALKFGTLWKAPDATTLTAQSIDLQAARPCFIDVDGEIRPFRAGKITIRPGALTVFVPPPKEEDYSAASASAAIPAGAGPP